MPSLAARSRTVFAGLQASICEALERADGGARFGSDRWRHDAGVEEAGGGVSRVLADGAVLEKAGVNFSAVRGELTPRLADKLKVAPQGFFATGVSLVVHPRSPLLPTAHMNVRYLEMQGGGGAWFGGGADLTPYYLIEDDVRHFHGVWRDVCRRHAVASYARFKKRCDEYFHLPHRGEARGVGGIFFDYLRDDPEATFDFVQDTGRSFIEAYLPILEHRRNEPWGEREREWQLVRRGRYVEFNLVHDRGTLFGLETGGRTESILMSLPPLARWAYDHRPEAGSREARLLEVLRAPREWVSDPP